jgi:GMP synthase PP-ATPase subunit
MRATDENSEVAMVVYDITEKPLVTIKREQEWLKITEQNEGL